MPAHDTDNTSRPAHNSPPAATAAVPPFPDSTFARTRPGTVLPSPAEVRARGAADRQRGRHAPDPNHPPPVTVPELGLVVKYGRGVARAEADAQRMVARALGGRVPVPEVFGWAEDAGQGFLYMALVAGDTLASRWKDMAEDERLAVCAELKGMVEAWRSLAQPEPDHVFIGSATGGPLNDVIVADRPQLRGPWRGRTAVRDFHKACGIELSDDVPIVFTHADLVACNVLVTPGRRPRVAAVLDWAQAGWYPSYWEYCKARWVMMPEATMDDGAQDEWRDRYLPLVLRRLDDETWYYPFLQFSLRFL